MLSLDVKSLSINISIEGALDSLEKRLCEFHYSSIEIKEILKLSQFVWANNLYLQWCLVFPKWGSENENSTFSLPLWYLYAQFKEKFLSIHKFPHWFRYVDDTFILVSSNTDFSSLLFFVNLIGCCIQFIFEVVKDNSFSFPDVLVSKHIDSFSITVFSWFF